MTTAGAPVGAETAAALATAQVPVATPEQPVQALLGALRGRAFQTAAVVAVCTPDRRLRGLVTATDLLAAPVDATVGEVMDRHPPVVTPEVDREQVAWLAAARGCPAVAVVDPAGRFVGLVPATRLLTVLLAEHHEDLSRLGGLVHSTAATRATTTEPVPRRVWHRLPWLAVGLVGAMVSAVLVGAFEQELADVVLIAFFIPGIVYLADAVGTQTEVIAIRGLSVGVGIGRIVGREALTGLATGVLLGVALLPLVVVVWGDARVAAAVALAVAAASTVAAVVALLLPWLLHRSGRDPAFGAGPLSTVIQDLLSIAIYLGVAQLLVV